MSQAQLDLRELALERPNVQVGAKSRRRDWMTRYVIPLGVLAGFSGLLVVAAGEQWLPRESVTVVPVIVSRADVQQEGTPLFKLQVGLSRGQLPLTFPPSPKESSRSSLWWKGTKSMLACPLPSL